MIKQLDIFEIHSRENNRESEQILSDNREHLSAQCVTVLAALKRGERLTTTEALLKYKIGDLRRRVKDLKENGYNVKGDLLKNRFKEYYLEK